jgi:hypothetical protein
MDRSLFSNEFTLAFVKKDRRTAPPTFLKTPDQFQEQQYVIQWMISTKFSPIKSINGTKSKPNRNSH